MTRMPPNAKGSCKTCTLYSTHSKRQALPAYRTCNPFLFIPSFFLIKMKSTPIFQPSNPMLGVKKKSQTALAAMHMRATTTDYYYFVRITVKHFVSSVVVSYTCDAHSLVSLYALREIWPFLWFFFLNASSALLWIACVTYAAGYALVIN